MGVVRRTTNNKLQNSKKLADAKPFCSLVTTKIGSDSRSNGRSCIVFIILLCVFCRFLLFFLIDYNYRFYLDLFLDIGRFLLLLFLYCNFSRYYLIFIIFVNFLLYLLDNSCWNNFISPLNFFNWLRILLLFLYNKSLWNYLCTIYIGLNFTLLLLILFYISLR